MVPFSNLDSRHLRQSFIDCPVKRRRLCIGETLREPDVTVANFKGTNIPADEALRMP
jgi:hypothetical protein